VRAAPRFLAPSFMPFCARQREYALRSPVAIRRQVPAILVSRGVGTADVVRGEVDGVAVGCRVDEPPQAHSVRVNARSAQVALIAGTLRLR
jgi:hypothetical protein